MTAPASPGTLSRIDEMRPPYSQPHTPRQQDQRDSGGSFIAKAIGIRMATPLIGPRPGSSPTTVPMKAADQRDHQVGRACRRRRSPAEH
jgi:hypothetical protein